MIYLAFFSVFLGRKHFGKGVGVGDAKSLDRKWFMLDFVQKVLETSENFGKFLLPWEKHLNLSVRKMETKEVQSTVPARC